MTDTQKIEELEAEVAALKNALAAQHTAAETKRVVDFDKIKSAIDSSAKTVLEAVKPVVAKYQEPGRAAVEKVGGKVSENPFLSVVAAFGAGIVIGKLLELACRSGGNGEN